METLSIRVRGRLQGIEHLAPRLPIRFRALPTLTRTRSDSYTSYACYASYISRSNERIGYDRDYSSARRSGLTPPIASTMPSEPDASREREIPSLAPMDRGRQAWSFIAAGFAIEMLLWGGLFSTGVFLKHYSTNKVSGHAHAIGSGFDWVD